jgi:hypothetical protein
MDSSVIVENGFYNGSGILSRYERYSIGLHRYFASD